MNYKSKTSTFIERYCKKKRKWKLLSRRTKLTTKQRIHKAEDNWHTIFQNEFWEKHPYKAIATLKERHILKFFKIQRRMEVRKFWKKMQNRFILQHTQGRMNIMEIRIRDRVHRNEQRKRKLMKGNRKKWKELKNKLNTSKRCYRTRFLCRTLKSNAEPPRFEAEKAFTHEAAPRRAGSTNLKAASPKAGAAAGATYQIKPRRRSVRKGGWESGKGEITVLRRRS